MGVVWRCGCGCGLEVWLWVWFDFNVRQIKKIIKNLLTFTHLKLISPVTTDVTNTPNQSNRQMRDHVNSKWYLIRKKMDNLIHRLFPNSWIPLYTTVSGNKRNFKMAVEVKFKGRIRKFFTI